MMHYGQNRGEEKTRKLGKKHINRTKTGGNFKKVGGNEVFLK